MSQVGASYKDSSTSVNVDIEGINVASAPPNPAGGNALRQTVALGDGGGAAQFVTVDDQSNLHVTTARWQTVETTALLSSNGVYTGSAHDTTVDGEKWVVASARSAQASAASGFKIQISDDNSNWLDNNSATTVNANTSTVIEAYLPMRYWRIVYTNGASAQTGSFAIYCNLSATVPNPVAKAGQALPQGGLGALVVQGVASGVKVPVDGSGVTQPVSVNAGSSVIGKVGIDQTTPGTTNLVQTTQGSTTGTLGSLNASLSTGLMGVGASWMVMNVSGTWTGQITVKDGNNSANVAVYRDGLGYTMVVPVTANGAYIVVPSLGDQAGLPFNVQAVMTAYTSGTATVTFYPASAYLAQTARNKQSPFPLAIQANKDAARTQVYIGATQITGTTSESVITCNITKGQSAQVAASTYTVTTGNTLRIQSIRYGVSGAAGVATIRLRLTSVSGAPIWEDSLNFGATTDNQSSETQSFPDGLELSSGTVLNWTQICASTSQKVDVALVGFEY